MKFAGAREAEPRRLMCGVPVRHPELAAAPDLKPKLRIHVFRPSASPAGSKLSFKIVTTVPRSKGRAWCARVNAAPLDFSCSS